MENVVCVTCRKKVLRKCWDSARCWIRRWTPSSRDCPNSRRASRRARNSSRRTHHRSTSRAKRWPAAAPRVLAIFRCYLSLLRSSPDTSCRSWTIRVCSCLCLQPFHSVSNVCVVEASVSVPDNVLEFRSENVCIWKSRHFRPFVTTWMSIMCKISCASWECFNQ